MGTPSIATLGKMGLDVSTVTGIADFDAGSIQLEYISEQLKMTETHAYNAGIRGTRSRVKERVRSTRKASAGQIVMTPTPVELDTLFYLILGTAEAADSFVLAETIPQFGVLIDRIANRFIYTGCFVSRATFRGSQGELITLTLDVEAKTEVVSATVFPVTVPVIDAGAPYIMGDCTFALSADASAAEVKEFEIVIDNVLNTDRFMNSVTRSQIPTTDRIITLAMSVPYTADEIDLHAQSVAGAAGTLTLTNGGTSTLFTFANLKSPADSPVNGGRGQEGMLNLQMTAYQSSTTKELVITHDSSV